MIIFFSSSFIEGSILEAVVSTEYEKEQIQILKQNFRATKTIGTKTF